MFLTLAEVEGIIELTMFSFVVVIETRIRYIEKKLEKIMKEVKKK